MSSLQPFQDLDAPPLLEGKVAIITGASRGIGAQTARVFAAAGASLALAARDEGALIALADELSSDGRGAIPIPTDVGDAAAIEQLVAKTVDTFGRLDAAFNNAAGGDSHRRRSPTCLSRPTTALSPSRCEASSSA